MIEYAEGKLLSANCIHKLNKIFTNRLITFELVNQSFN